MAEGCKWAPLADPKAERAVQLALAGLEKLHARLVEVERELTEGLWGPAAEPVSLARAGGAVQAIAACPELLKPEALQAREEQLKAGLGPR